jgi:hypothetical protein
MDEGNSRKNIEEIPILEGVIWVDLGNKKEKDI